MPAQFVVPYRRGNKTDATDAAAICEAVQRPNMRFVPNKSQHQADIQAVHRVRSGYIRARTATINKIRALLAENGIILPQGSKHVGEKVMFIISDESNCLSGMMRQVLFSLYEHLCELKEKISRQDVLLTQVSKESDDCKRGAKNEAKEWIGKGRKRVCFNFNLIQIIFSGCPGFSPELRPLLSV